MGDKSTTRPWYFDELRGDDGLGYICAADGTEISHHGNSELSQAENLDAAALTIRAANRDHLFGELVKVVQGIGRGSHILTHANMQRIQAVLEKVRASDA